jgi:8-oxo-dGTP pyrophosphatase MutT (NUDIX family)
MEVEDPVHVPWHCGFQLRAITHGEPMNASTVSNIQYAALPWRRAEGVIEFLLITTRNTGRWIVPKGWPLTGRTPAECAAQEALEEAGLIGKVATEPVGWFHYDKQRKSGEVVACKVQVYPMEVARQRRSWAEKTVRQTHWCTLDEALSRVGEPGLRQLIQKFAKTRHVGTRHVSVRHVKRTTPPRAASAR